MHSHPAESPAHLTEAFAALPPEQAELLLLFGVVRGPDLPTSVFALLMADGDESQGPPTVSGEDTARADGLLRDLADRGLIGHTPGDGSLPDRWSTTAEQAAFVRRMGIARLEADMREIQMWTDAVESDMDGIRSEREELGGSGAGTGSDAPIGAGSSSGDGSQAGPAEQREAVQQAVDQLFGVDAVLTAWQTFYVAFQASGDRHGEAAASYNLGHALCEAGRHADALDPLEAAERLYSTNGDEPWRAHAAQRLAEARGQVGS